MLNKPISINNERVIFSTGRSPVRYPDAGWKISQSCRMYYRWSYWISPFRWYYPGRVYDLSEQLYICRLGYRHKQGCVFFLFLSWRGFSAFQTGYYWDQSTVWLAYRISTLFWIQREKRLPCLDIFRKGDRFQRCLWISASH